MPFDGAGGVAMSAVMGYRLHGMVRAEVEYVMRSSNYSPSGPGYSPPRGSMPTS